MTQVLATLALLTGGALEDVDNPDYKSWSKFKAGAMVKYKMVAEAGGTKTESEMSLKLVELTGEKAVVETAFLFGGNALPGERNPIPARIKRVEPQTDPAPPTKEGEEELEMAGKKVKTRWVETTVEQAAAKAVRKVWMTTEIPGGLARSETRSRAGTVTQVAVEWRKE